MEGVELGTLGTPPVVVAGGAVELVDTPEAEVEGENLRQSQAARRELFAEAADPVRIAAEAASEHAA